MFILLAFPGLFRHLEFSRFRVRNASKSKLSGTVQYSHNEAHLREQFPKVKDIMFERLLQFTQRLSWESNLASAMSRYVTFVFPIGNDKHRMRRPNRDGINILSGVVNQESALRLKFQGRVLNRSSELQSAFTSTYQRTLCIEECTAER
jgi:hypothetical protein